MAKDELILNQLSSLAKKMFPHGEGEVFLYGSRANGSAKRTSDWDILILTDDARSTSDDFASFALPFAEIGWKFGEQITPIHYTRGQWAAESKSAFYQSVISSYKRL